MSRHRRILPAAVLLLAAASTPAAGQTLHLNDRWKECSFVIAPSLTQDAWHQFVGELGVVMHLRPLSSARPMGARKLELALVNGATRIDDADAAWNDTFSHPDEDHVLFEGDALPIPGLMLRAGITDRMDAGAYATKGMGANYSLVGGQIQYSLTNTPKLATAVRVSAVGLFGPEDLSAGVFGADLVMSRDISILTPYLGIAGYLTRGREHTDKVELDGENVLGAQATFGVAASISALRLGAEVHAARVPGYSIKIAFGT
jgi:hypothetical protein